MVMRRLCVLAPVGASARLSMLASGETLEGRGRGGPIEPIGQRADQKLNGLETSLSQAAHKRLETSAVLYKTGGAGS